MGSLSVSGVKRALDPCTISTISPWPAPTVSTTTKVRPVVTSRSRFAGSTRIGSTVSSFRPVIDAIFCVATTLPVTLARNMAPSLREQRLCLPGDNKLFVGRHDPDLDATGLAMDVHFPLRLLVTKGVQG